jgi:hypothetical protein
MRVGAGTPMELGLNFGAGAYKDDAPDGASLTQATDSQVCLALRRLRHQGRWRAIDGTLTMELFKSGSWLQ